MLKGLQVILELPLNLLPIAPGHQPNWDLISDLVSSNYTNYYRNPLECKKRFENYIIKREELCANELHNKKQMLQLQQQQNKEQIKYKQPSKAPVNYIYF